VSDPVEIGKQVVGQAVTVAAANPLPVLILSFFLIAPALGVRWS
jgi:hypothetical protein